MCPRCSSRRRRRLVHAVIQIGTEIAVLIYSPATSCVVKHGRRTVRQGEANADYWLVGGYPRFGTDRAAGLLFKHYIRGDVRNLWIIATRWSSSPPSSPLRVLRQQTRTIEQFTWRDSLVIARSSVWR